MKLGRITLQNFRNVSWADLELRGRQQFFIGRNGQGKTNLLEAAGFGSALRSFRTHESRALVQHGKAEASLAYQWEDGLSGPAKAVITLRGSRKDVVCDGEKLTRFGDYLGRFPTVVFSSQDQQLVRGSPGQRRRWLDLLLASTDRIYLDHLQRYHRALEGRNQLLKRGNASAQVLAFEQPMAAHAEGICRARVDTLSRLGAVVSGSYAAIADAPEPVALAYVPASAATTAAEWLLEWERTRAKDQLLKSTSQGPHRDDFELTVHGKSAREYASEGQQRTLAIALRLAEVAWQREHLQTEPVLLADDVLGELDPGRRARFWHSLGSERQIIATGTTLPDAALGDWQVFEVDAGVFRQLGVDA